MARGIQIRNAALTQDLARVANAIQPVKVREVMRNGARLIRNEAERLAPVGLRSKKPGTLRRSIVIRNLPLGNKPAGVIVLVNVKGAPHLHLVEFGTRPHTITAKNGFLSLFGGKLFRALVRHPGAKPQPFFKPAVRNKRAAARLTIVEELKEIVESAARS